MSEHNLTGRFRHIDRYEIVRELGRGGTARVFLVVDPRDRRQYALKAIPNDAEDRNRFLVRFHQEFNAIKRLHHTHIIQTFDDGQTDELVFFTMEYIEGGTFRDLMHGKPLPISQAVDCAAQMGLALGHAHNNGIIHRDVKPSNILIRDQNENPRHMVLTDFGTAKVIGERGVTKSGMTIGTPEYMSPEQAEGSDDVDGRADIYALGCVLFEALVGRPPFEGPTPLSILFQHVHASVPILRGFNSDVPEPLAAVVERMLAKRPEDRYEHADQVVDDLRPFLGERFAADIRTVPMPPSELETAARIERVSPPIMQAPPNSLLDEPTITMGQVTPAAGARPPAPPAPYGPPAGVADILTQPPLGPNGSMAHGVAPAPGAHQTNMPARYSTMGPAMGSHPAHGPAMGVPSRPSGPGIPPGMRATGNLGDGPPVFGYPPTPFDPSLAGPPPPGQVDPTGRGVPSPTSQGLPGRARRPLAGGTHGPVVDPLTWTMDAQRKPRHSRRQAMLIAVMLALVLVVGGGVALLLTSGPDGSSRIPPLAGATNTTVATPTLKATATTAPTATTASTTMTPVASTSNADQAAAASFKNITVETGRDSTCSASNQVTKFSSGQPIYVDLCASQTVAHAPLKITVQRGGVVVWTLTSGTIYVSPGTDSFYYTVARFSPGSYSVVVTMQINGQTGTAKRIPITIA